MLVRFFMTPDPIAVAIDATLLEACLVMRRHHLRRLPVVVGKTPVGLLSQTDIFTLLGYGFINPHTPLPAELEAALAARRVRDHMTVHPATCTPHDALEEVGARMLEHNVRTLLVVHADELVGIITESDIFKALTRITCGEAGSCRICADVPSYSREDVLARIFAMCRDHGLQLQTILSHDSDRPGHHLVTVRVKGTKVEALIDELRRSHFQVLQVV